MKVRCIAAGAYSDELTIGKEYEVLAEIGRYYQLKINDKGQGDQCCVKSRFKVIEEEKEMKEKTFREVIADIKEGEVWESHCKRIIGNGAGDFKIENKSGEGFGSCVAIHGENKYRLKRKEYTFEEAFKAYENGKVIESCVTGDKYTWNGFTDLICKNGADGYSKLKSIYIEEIKGKWYINN